LGSHPTVKNHPPVHSTHHRKWHIGVHTFNYYCYYACLYKINYTNLPYLNAISDERTTHNLHYQYAKFSRRVAKIAQTVQNKHTTGNAIVAMVMLTRMNVAARRDFFVKSLLHFINPKYDDLEINNIFRKPMNRYIVHTEIMSTFHTLVENISRWTIRHSAKNARNHTRNSPFPLKHVDPI